MTDVAQKRYAGRVERITQRQLRNDNAEIMRRVEAGESFVVTRHGQPVADLVPHRIRSDGPQLFGDVAAWAAEAADLPPWDVEAWKREQAELDEFFIDDEPRNWWGDDE